MKIRLPSANQLFSYKSLLLYLILSSILLLKSYFDLDGCVSPDSAYYLSLSKGLLAGEGFRIADYNSPEGKSFFAIWPVGYPVMIFIISKLTGLGVFWASKVLNLLIIGFILILFRYIFKDNVHWAGLLLFVDSFVLVFSFTWSEGLFILLLLCFCISLYNFEETSGKLIWLVALFFSGIALFLTRYIGLFSVGIIGIITLLNLFRRRWHLSVKLLIISALQLIFAGLYLYHNFRSTGYATGMPRNLPQETNLELLYQLLAALKDEFIVIKSGIPLSLSFGLLLLLVLYLYFTRDKKPSGEKSDKLWRYFLLAGILYFLSIVSAKWFSDFTALDYRYLFPSTFLFFLSIASYLQGQPRLKIMKSTLAYLLVFLTLSIHYLPHTDYIYKYFSKGIGYFQNPNFMEKTKVISEKYKEIEPGSIVIFGPIHLRYLRENIIPTEIYGKSSIEDMRNYFSQNRNWNVYINIRDDLNPELFHESFIGFMKSNHDKQIVKVISKELY